MTPAPSRSSDAPPGVRPGGALVAVLVAAVVLGVLLRCEGLGRKALWYDEVGTTLRLSGHTEAEVALLADGSPQSPRELLRRFQSVRTGSIGDGAARVVRAVTEDESLHSPGYFLAAYLWTRIAGDGRAALRALSALASLAALALLGVLAWRLLRDRGAVLATLALAALSPLQIRYAQEGRSYALWSLTLLAAVLATLSAGERRTRRSWARVAAAFALALYVHPLSLLVIPALLLLAADCGADDRAPARNATAAALALCAAIALWLPWAAVVIANRHQSVRTAAWMGDAAPLASVVRAWFGVLTSILYRPSGPGGVLDGIALPGTGLIWLTCGVLAFVLAVAAIAHVSRHAPRGARRFVPALALVPFAALAAADVVLGGRRSTVDRYLLPAWLAVELAVAFLLAAPGPRARLRHAVLVVVLALGAATALRSRPLELWWNTEPERLAALRAVAAELRTQQAPPVLTDGTPLRVLELAHHLPADASLRVGSRGPERLAADEWPRVVIVAPSDDLLARTRAAAARAGATVVRSAGALAWRVVPAP